MAIVCNAVYVDGHRIVDPESLDETYQILRELKGMAWIGLYQPSVGELKSAEQEFGLHELAIEDAVTAHQRPKLERYGNVLFTVLRPARYLDDVELVEFGELHVFIGPDFVITIRQGGSPDLGSVRRRMEANPNLLSLGPEAVLYATLDQVVDEYEPVVKGIQNDIDEIENQLFEGHPEVSRRIYELFGEVIEFQRATHPLVQMLKDLAAGFEKYRVSEELQRDLRDVLDHVYRIVSQADSFRVLLQNALTTQTTLVAQRQSEEMKNLTEASLAQNEEVKKISAWAAILFAPTLVGTTYGMNFEGMPELSWKYGYALAIGLMLTVSVTLYLVFKGRDWL